MIRRTPVYGLDIETDTTVDALDPAVARILTVALSTDEVDELFVGDEPSLLCELDDRLGSLPPGVIATWNGAAFDLPFIADRAALHNLTLGLRLEQDARLAVRRSALPGHRGAYRCAWHHHAHLDAYRVFRSDASLAVRLSCGLRSIARSLGLSVAEPHPVPSHDLSQEALHAYASSDARLARVLSERRWSSARRLVDPDPTVLAEPVDHSRRLAARNAAQDAAAQPTAETPPGSAISFRGERRSNRPGDAAGPLADAG